MPVIKRGKRHTALLQVSMFLLAVIVAICCIVIPSSTSALEISREWLEDYHLFVYENGKNYQDIEDNKGNGTNPYNWKLSEIIEFGRGDGNFGSYWTEGSHAPGYAPLKENSDGTGTWKDGNPPTITSSVWGMLSKPGDAFRFWLANGIATGYGGVYDSAAGDVENARQILTQGLDGTSQDGTNTNDVWNAIYNFAEQICNNFILPIGIVVLAFILAMEIYQLVCERNNMNDLGAGSFIQLFMRFAIAIIIIANAWVLCNWFFNLAGAVVDNMSTLSLGGGNDDDFKYSTDDLEFLYWFKVVIDKNLTMGGTIMALMESWILSLMGTILGIVVWVLVYIRLIEIYFMMAAAPIPLATFTNREWGQMGRNYLKSLAALAFQAVLMLMAIMMYAVMVRNSINMDEYLKDADLFGNMWEVLGFSVVLVFVLMKTGSISKSIFDAH